MSYSFSQKRKAKRAELRKYPARAVAPGKQTQSNNPSLIISRMAKAEGARTGKKIEYWEYIKKNYKKFGGPAPIRVPMAMVVEEIDREKAEKRKARRAAQ